MRILLTTAALVAFYGSAAFAVEYYPVQYPVQALQVSQNQLAVNPYVAQAYPQNPYNVPAQAAQQPAQAASQAQAGKVDIMWMNSF